MEIIYRPVDITNLEEMKRIARIDITIPALYDSDFHTDEKAVEDHFNHLVKMVKAEDFFEVAICNGDIIGFHLVKKVPYMRGLFAGSVYTLWVHPDFRGHGIARTLKLRGEEWAKNLKLDHIHTWVSSKNEPMLAANKSMGYEIVNIKFKKKL